MKVDVMRGYKPHMREMRNSYSILVEHLNRRNHLGELAYTGNDIKNECIEKYGVLRGLN